MSKLRRDGFLKEEVSILLGRKESGNQRLAAVVSVEYFPEVFHDIAIDVALETASSVLARYQQEYMNIAEQEKN